MEILLLLGLLVLWAKHQALSHRVKALEEEKAQFVAGVLPDADFAPDPLSERRMADPDIAPVPAAPAEAEPEIELPESAEPAPALSAGENLGGIFERFVGGRLLIWVGGIALAVAGIFLVRYSIEIGLITPPVRMAMAAIFGLLLLGAGEFARSRPDGLIDPRAGQSLVGAGILVLYSTTYGSLVLYQLIGNGTAFALMAVVTAVALILSLRHGAPAAVMGLVGGFATPLLVGERSDTAIPLLSYLALLNIALFVLAGRRGWTWLAAAAVVLSFAWTGALLGWPREDALAAGVFILGLSLAASLARAGSGWHLDFIRPAAIGLLELAVLVGRVDIGLPAWGLFGALSLACFFLAGRSTEYRWLPGLALALALVLLAGKAIVWLDPWLPYVALAITLIFAGGSLPGALRGGNRLGATAVASAAFAGPVLILRLARPELVERPFWGLLFLVLSLGPLFLASLRRKETHAGEADLPLFVSAGTALTLAGIGAYDLLPLDLLGSAWLLLALAAGLAAARLKDSGLTALALVGLSVAALWSIGRIPELWATLFGSLIGEPALASNLPSPGAAALVLLLPLPLLFLLWRLLPADYRQLRAAPLAVMGLFAVAAAYIFFKQIFALGSQAEFVALGLAERTIINQALFVAGWLICSGRLPLPSLDEPLRRLTGTLLTALAAARLLWFDMLIHNPALSDQRVGELPVLNLILPAYLLSAFWLYKVRRGAPSTTRSGLWLGLFLAALILGVMLMVRQLFHGSDLDRPEIYSSESYGYSLAGLLLSVAMLLGGIRLPDKALRLAGLILLTATTLKVFLSDAAALEGLLRILSFLGLGIALIGIGKLYTKVLNAEARPAPGG